MNLDKEFAAIRSKVDSLQELADAQVQPPQKFKDYTKLDDKVYRWSAYRDSGWGCFNLQIEYFFWRSNGWGEKIITKELLDKTLDKFDQTKDQWFKDNEETFKYNTSVTEHNKLQYDRVVKIMETVGVKPVREVWGYKTARSSKMTKSIKRAGFPDDLAEAIPLSDGYKSYLDKIDNLRERIFNYGTKWIKDNEERLRKEAEESARIEKERKEVNVLAGLRVKYDLDLDEDAEDILSTITSQCKYLYLAHYLLKNRNNWNDGSHYAEIGLSGFDVDTEKDKEIYEQINNLCDDWQGDGRCFRDCTWSYDVLFGMVDSKLLQDYEAISEFVEDY